MSNVHDAQPRRGAFSVRAAHCAHLVTTQTMPNVLLYPSRAFLNRQCTVSCRQLFWAEKSIASENGHEYADGHD
jgi:hypothetical protein